MDVEADGRCDTQHLTYLIPDEQFESACAIIKSLGYSTVEPTNIERFTRGELDTKGRHFLITIDCNMRRKLILVPFSFSTLRKYELRLVESQRTFFPSPFPVLSPRPEAIYAALIRLIGSYPPYGPERATFLSDLSQLVDYHLLDIQDGYANISDPQVWADMHMDERNAAAVEKIRSWRWRVGEEWMGPFLEGYVLNKKGFTLDDLPCREPEDVPDACADAEIASLFPVAC
jgi:hypothetical protein